MTFGFGFSVSRVMRTGGGAPPFTGVLDLLSAASAAAYSLRKLRTAYAGDAIRVRRSSDNAEQDIGFDPAGDLDTVAMLDFVGLENLLIQSQTFTDGSWIKSRGSIVAGAALAPDGTMTASKLVEDNSPATNHRIFSIGGSAIRFLPATVSFHAKAAERTQCFVRMTNEGGGTLGAYFDLLNGTVLSSEAGVTASIQDLGDGWYRCAVTRQSSGIDPNAYIAPAVNGSEFYDGDGTSGILIWGAQNNQGTTAKTYVATTATISGAGFVTTWYDQSGNAQNATQATAASQARIAGSGGRDALFFDGVNDSMALALNATLVPPYTTNVVANRIAGSNYQRVLSGSPDNRLLVGALSGNYISTTGDGAAWNSIGAANTPLTQIASASRVLTAIVETGSTSPFIDGVAMDVRNNTLNANSLPSLLLGGQTNQWWNGGVFEVVVLAAEPSTADRQALERSQGTHYGIPVA